MVMCFAVECKHYSERGTCKFFRFPVNEALKKQWEKLIGCVDKKPTKHSRLCSCHFKDGLKENGPTMFIHNVQKQLVYLSPSPKKGIKPRRTEINVRDVVPLSTDSQICTTPSSGSSICTPAKLLEFVSSLQNLTVSPILKPATPPQPQLQSTDVCTTPARPSTSTPTRFVTCSRNLFESFKSKSPSPPQASTSQSLSTISEEITSETSILFEASNYFLEKEITEIKMEQKKSSFCFEQISHSDELIVLYTGLPNKDIFMALFELLINVDVNYWNGWKVLKITPINQLFMTMYKLRFNTPYEDIAFRFNCSKSTVSNIFVTWLHLLHETIYKSLMAKVPSRAKNMACLPNCFSSFPNTRMVLDCTEVGIEVPHALDKQRETFSYYKHRNTVKALVGVAPNGVVTYVSKLYPGSTSDKMIVDHCGVLSIFKEGDLILADKGFLISDLLPPGVSVNIPPFLLQLQFTPEQVAATKSIARARIHVERAIRRIKGYHILDLIPQNLVPHSTVIFQVCTALTNFQYPLLKEVEIYYKNC